MRILGTLDRYLEGRVRIRLMGGAAMILGYGFDRATEDVDLLADEREVQAMIDAANLGAALDATNRALEAEGLYLSHIWGPEQQILTPEWRASCRSIVAPFQKLEVEALGPLDLILSKACRADDGDLEDIRFLIQRERIERPALEQAFARAIVPAVFAEVLPENKRRIFDLLPP